MNSGSLPISRRRFIHAFGLTFGTALLAACSGAPTAPGAPGVAPTTAPAATSAARAAAPAAAASADMIAAPEPGAKKGGVFTIAGPGDPAHFDLDQSPSLVNLWP
jgi:hypothetical protein